MSMAKLAKTINVSLENKAADILYDYAQDCDMSLTAFLEGIAYTVAAMRKEEKKDFLNIVKSIQEPGN